MLGSATKAANLITWDPGRQGKAERSTQPASTAGKTTSPRPRISSRPERESSSNKSLRFPEAHDNLKQLNGPLRSLHVKSPEHFDPATDFGQLWSRTMAQTIPELYTLNAQEGHCLAYNASIRRAESFQLDRGLFTGAVAQNHLQQGFLGSQALKIVRKPSPRSSREPTKPSCHSICLLYRTPSLQTKRFQACSNRIKKDFGVPKLGYYSGT